MKLKRKGAVAVAAVCVGLVLAVGIGVFMGAKREARSPVVSVGVQRVADAARLCISAPVGESVCFAEDFFDVALGGAPLAALTVTRLPDATAGELLLGYGEVSVSQTVRRENFSYLSFSPVSGGEASFCFIPETEDGVLGYEVCCTLRFTEGVNGAPVGTAATLQTHAGLSLDGTLAASDPDGDALYFEVVSYPENGTLALDGATGVFTYLPAEGFDGTDAFTWRVQDENGAFGEAREVSLTVYPLQTGYYYADMEGNGAHSAALCVTEKGLMSGEMIGGKPYFHPHRTLTRAAFVTMLLEAAEVKCPEAESTGYTDDADIPPTMKGAIKYAREKGWLGEDTVFRPDDAVTRAEAAQIAARVLGLSAPSYEETVRDHDEIAVGVADALYAVFEGGYLSAMSDGTLSPAATLTRAECAVMLAKVAS